MWSSMKCIKTAMKVPFQTGVCKYLLNCPTCNTEANYTNHILCDIITRGISDSEIRLELLGHMNQNMTLEEVFQFIKTKETGKRCVTHRHETQGVESAQSHYWKQQQQQSKMPPGEPNLKNLTPAITVENEVMARLPLATTGKRTTQLLIKSVTSVTALTILKQFVAAKFDLNHRPTVKIPKLMNHHA